MTNATVHGGNPLSFQSRRWPQVTWNSISMNAGKTESAAAKFRVSLAAAEVCGRQLANGVTGQQMEEEGRREGGRDEKKMKKIKKEEEEDDQRKRRRLTSVAEPGPTAGCCVAPPPAALRRPTAGGTTEDLQDARQDVSRGQECARGPTSSSRPRLSLSCSVSDLRSHSERSKGLGGRITHMHYTDTKNPVGNNRKPSQGCPTS